MRGLAMVTMVTGVTAAAAAAETPMGEAQLDALLTGNTVYIEVPPGGPGGPDGGIAPFLYGADGRAVAVLPAGLTLVGTWRLEGDRYCVDWDNGPKDSCTRLVKSAEALLMVDPKTGETRGAVESIRPGNPEAL
ncbi:MAG: hypothetical protein AAGA47_06040 [Pseudomonadota bacterium]